MDPISLYLHIPFCRHKCSYCDFNTYAGMDERIEPYVRALCAEVAQFAAAAGQKSKVHTVFLGGGTPSLLSSDQLERILASVHNHFELLEGAEITMEANPGTVSQRYLDALRGLGVNRLSYGMQSSNLGELELLEREHNHLDVIQAVGWSRKAGFRNLNLDLIFGLPMQSLSAWQQTLSWALELAPEHFSLYALTLEHGTPLKTWVDRGLLALPEPDLAAEMYEWAAERLERAGYQQYEISNWARAAGLADLRCRHNLQYWRNDDYVGLGAGAHGHIGGYRTANVRGPAAYIERCADGRPRPFPRTPATAEVLPVDSATRMNETMLMGLRLTEEGVSESRFSGEFSAAIMDIFEAEITPLLQNGLLAWSGEEPKTLRLTARGRLLGNQVFRAFV